MNNPKQRNEISDKTNPTNRTIQAKNRDDAFALRLLAALGGRDWAWLARETGLPTSTVHEYGKGVIPRADKAVVIARAVGTTVEALFGGTAIATDNLPEGWSLLPHIDLFSFTAAGKPEAGGFVPVPISLFDQAKISSASWLATMPSDSIPEIAREGGIVICQDAVGELVDSGVYVFMLDWRPLVRRVAIRPEGIVLKASDPSIDPLTISRNGEHGLVPVARIVGSVSVRPV